MDLDPEQFDEALAALRERVLVTDAEYAVLSEKERRKAFWVANAATADMVREVWLLIDRAVADGITFEQWKDEFERDPLEIWTASRLQTIFRTNVQQAYSDGRWRQQTDPDVMPHRPFWAFDGVEDFRQSNICKKLNGVVLPADDPFWRTHNPPLHFSCRSTIISLDAEEAHAMGVTHDRPQVEADEGFGHAPDSGQEWSPNPSDYPSVVADVLNARLTGVGGRVP